MSNKKGFTLIELLVVIGILAILLAITLVAVNPGAQLQQAEETEVRSGATQMLNAINQYMVDNAGNAPSAISGTEQAISNAAADICADLVPTYIAALPEVGGDGVDSTECASYTTGYNVVELNDRVTVSAISDPSISVTR